MRSHHLVLLYYIPKYFLIVSLILTLTILIGINIYKTLLAMHNI